MFTLLKGTPLLLLLITSQAHAGFIFCESKLKKIGMTKDEAKYTCSTPFIDSAKKMLDTEDPKVMLKVFKLMNSSLHMSDYSGKFEATYKISDPQIALKAVKILPEDALPTFYKLVDRFNLDKSMKMASLIPPEKMKYAQEIAEHYNKGDEASFYNLISSASADQLAAQTLLVKKLPYEKAADISSKYTKKDIECGLGFTFVSADDYYKYENYISMCNQYHAGKLCNAKAMIFTTLLKDRTTSSSPGYLDKLANSDHFSKNHAAVFDKIISAGFYSEMYSTIDTFLDNETIPDKLANDILKEFENPFVTSEHIRKLIEQSPASTTVLHGQTFEKQGAVTAEWGNGSNPACSSDKGRSAIRKAVQETQTQCEKYYIGKKALKCDVTIDKNTSQGICRFTVKVGSTFNNEKNKSNNEKTKSCYDQDLQDGLTAVTKINADDKKNDSALVNDSKLQKEVEKVPSTENKIDSAKTSDR